MNTQEKDKLSAQIKAVLDRSVDDLDADTQYQLRMTRTNVLNNDSQRRQNWPVFAGITGFATVSALTAWLVLFQPHHISGDRESLSGIDSVLIEANTNTELYGFYIWLSQQELKS